MKAILTDANQRLLWNEVPDPVPTGDEVLIEICAAALNRADLMQRAGDYPPPPGCPEWMGLEVSGVITAMGEGARTKSTWRIGDRVCALLGGGGYAEYVTVRYDMLMPIPRGISMVEAAAMPEAFATAYLNLFFEGGAQAGETLLMHAGASGLASVVIPMAKAFGLRVVTSVLSTEMSHAIAPLGADRVIDSSRESIPEALRAEMEAGHPIHIAIDCLGGVMMGESLPFMARGGRWIMIATLAGDRTEIDLKMMYKLGLRVIGSTLRSRAPAVKAQILAALVQGVWPKVEAGLVRPTIYCTLPIQGAEEAHAILQRGENVGKVVLIVKPDATA